MIYIYYIELTNRIQYIHFSKFNNNKTIIIKTTILSTTYSLSPVLPYKNNYVATVVALQR